MKMFEEFCGSFHGLTITGLRSRSRSRKESEVFGWTRSRIPNNTGGRSQIFVRLRMSNWIIFKITLLNWEFLLQWYNFL